MHDKEADAKLDKHELYAMFLERMEDEVASLLCVDRSTKNNEWGRQEGPTFVVRNAFKDNEVGARRTTAVSRAWRRSARWLNDLRHAKTLEDKDDTIRKLLFYCHPAPPQISATKEQLEGFAGFSAWRSILKRERLRAKSGSRACTPQA